MRRLAIAALLAGACARQPWTRGDRGLEVLALATVGVDYAETLRVSGACAESNPVIGPCYEAGRTEAYFAAVAAVHVLVADRLPRGWRLAWQVATVAVESWAIYHNVRAGYGAEGGSP